MRKLTLLTVGVLWLAWPATVEAQIFDASGHTAVCSIGAYRVCASVTIFTNAADNSIVMRVANLHGVDGDLSTITSVGFYHTTAADAWNGTLLGNTDPALGPRGFEATYVTASGAYDRTANWSTPANDIKTLAGVDVTASAGTGAGHKGGIVGCADPSGPGAQHDATCQDDVYNLKPAYMQFTFRFSTPNVSQFSFNNLHLRFHAQQLGIDQDDSYKCDTNLPPGVEYGCEVVPEPVTMVLLGTGLAGVGGAGMLRRRRKKNDVENG